MQIHKTPKLAIIAVYKEKRKDRSNFDIKESE